MTEHTLEDDFDGFSIKVQNAVIQLWTDAEALQKLNKSEHENHIK